MAKREAGARRPHAKKKPSAQEAPKIAASTSTALANFVKNYGELKKTRRARPGSGTASLLMMTPEQEALWAKEKLEEQEWYLRRLAMIQSRYHTEEMHRFIAEVWRRVSPPDVEWTESNLRDFTIFCTVEDLEKETAKARESIKAGDTWSNKHFRNVQQCDEYLSFLLRDKLDDGLKIAKARRNASATTTKNRRDRYAEYRAFVEALEAKTPGLQRKATVAEAAKNFRLKNPRTIYRALAEARKSSDKPLR